MRNTDRWRKTVPYGLNFFIELGPLIMINLKIAMDVRGESIYGQDQTTLLEGA